MVAGLATSFSVADRLRLPRAPATVFLVGGYAAAIAVFRAAGHVAGAGSDPDPAIAAGTSGLALPLVLLLGFVIARAARLPAAALLDATCAGLAPALAIQYVGCAVAGCDPGAAVPPGAWASLLERLGAERPLAHPVSLYESAGLAAATPLVVVLALRRNAGVAAAAFLAAWGVVRLAVIPLRADAPVDAAATGVAAACAAVGVTVLALRLRARRPPGPTSIER